MKARLLEHAARHAFVIPAFVIAALLKWHYSQASADDLRWILLPTSVVTALVMRADFAFYPGEGYLSREHSVLISPACAGVNFAIVAFLSLVLAFGPRLAGWRKSGLWLGASWLLAYAATVLVNALRISLSIAVAHLAASHLGLTFQSVHRLLGIVVYVTGLMALCLTVRLWLSSRNGFWRSTEPVSSRAALLVAAVCYLAITLGIPLLRGAAHNPGYWSHAAPVSVLVGFVLALVFAARGRSWDDGRYARRSSEQSG